MQKIDTELDQIQSRLNDIATAINADETVRVAQGLVGEASKNLSEARRSLREAEDVVQSVQTKLSTSTEALYGGTIRNPKELKDLQEEVASLKRRLAVVEDHQLETMLVVEQAEGTYAALNNELMACQARLSERQASLIGEQERLSKILQRLKAERKATIGSILPDNLQIYERLRNQKRGLAVVLIEDSACAGCGASLRPAEIQSARSPSQLVFCSSCSRIFYAG
ncbi:MAG: hypothetical protein U1B80_05250 [Anaerolineaceae bacterium]|nr:hypothetical protein [Anaerolineaceae bacterium]